MEAEGAHFVFGGGSRGVRQVKEAITVRVTACTLQPGHELACHEAQATGVPIRKQRLSLSASLHAPRSRGTSWPVMKRRQLRCQSGRGG